MLPHSPRVTIRPALAAVGTVVVLLLGSAPPGRSEVPWMSDLQAARAALAGNDRAGAVLHFHAADSVFGGHAQAKAA